MGTDRHIDNKKVMNDKTNVKQIPIYCNYNICDKVNTQYARALLGRDYKGFGTSSETSNAVFVIRKL